MPESQDLSTQDAVREAQDLLFFAYRDFTHAADTLLDEMGLGRAHHRALHFIGRHPGMTVSGLLDILRITKQALARVLSELLERGLVVQSPGETDRRQRRLRLTEAGLALEQQLFARQHARLAPAFAAAGAEAFVGFRAVMQAIMTPADQHWLRAAMDRGPQHGG